MLNDNLLIEQGKIRTRMAPSPTGFLHIGTARTALFNFLFAKKYQGSFILRIEDTDIKRSNSHFEKNIMENLRWLGIEWDEGPISNNPAKALRQQKYIGDYGPYRQSERLDIYQKYIKKLLNENKAYYCFCSLEELEAHKQYQISIGEPPRYSEKCAQLSQKEIKKKIAAKNPWVIRFRIFPKKIEFNDLIRGKLEFDTSLIGDIVIVKNLFIPLYNFAVVVDDFDMKISHIIRGEDHISNTPKQILLQEALGFPRPQYAHLPLILGTDRAKLSKRHGATNIDEYKTLGYLPEALINFISFLGWNPGTEREIFSLSSLIKEFSLERIQKGGAIFNVKKLDYLNAFYIRQKSADRLTELCLPYIIKTGLIKSQFKPVKKFLFNGVTKKAKTIYQITDTKEIISFEILKKIISLYQERIKKISEISDLIDFFFIKKLKYNKELLRWKKMTDKELLTVFDKLKKILSKIKEEDFSKENLEKILIPKTENIGRIINKETIGKEGDRGYLLWPLRVALTNKNASASPFEIAEILGKEKTLKRIEVVGRLF